MFTIPMQYLTQCNLTPHDVFWRKFSKVSRFVHLTRVQKCVNVSCLFFFVNVLAENTAVRGRAGSVLQLFPTITGHTSGPEIKQPDLSASTQVIRH